MLFGAKPNKGYSASGILFWFIVAGIGIAAFGALMAVATLMARVQLGR